MNHNNKDIDLNNALFLDDHYKSRSSDASNVIVSNGIVYDVFYESACGNIKLSLFREYVQEPVCNIMENDKDDEAFSILGVTLWIIAAAFTFIIFSILFTLVYGFFSVIFTTPAATDVPFILLGAFIFRAIAVMGFHALLFGVIRFFLAVIFDDDCGRSTGLSYIIAGGLCCLLSVFVLNNYDLYGG